MRDLNFEYWDMNYNGFVISEMMVLFPGSSFNCRFCYRCVTWMFEGFNMTKIRCLISYRIALYVTEVFSI